MTADIVRYEGTLEARAKAWANMPDGDRRRLAMKAANERDEAMLWAITEAYVANYGRKSYDVSEHTLSTYRYGLWQMLEHWQDVNLLRPTETDARRLIGELVREKPSKGTVHVIVSAIRQAYKALMWCDAVTSNPFEKIRPPKDPIPAHEKRDAYTSDDLEALRHVAVKPPPEAGRDPDPADLAMLLLGAHAGLRASEMVDLEWSDLDRPKGYLLVRKGKGGKSRKVPISDGLREALEALKAQNGARDRVLPFQNRRARERLERLCREAFGYHYEETKPGNQRRVPNHYLPLHSLRHYFGTRAYRRLGIRAAQDLLGHSSVETTARYAKTDHEEAREELASWE